MTFINDIHEENMREKLYDILNDMSDDDIVMVWNRYCDNNNYYDEMIEFMDFLDDFFCDMSATEILEHIDRDFDVTDEYFRSTYCFESFNDPYDAVDVDYLVDYILDSEETLGSDELVEFFEEVEEQNDRYEELEELAEEKGSVLTVLYGDYFVNVILNGRKVKNVKAKVAN